jgi:hypothetical protein
MLTDKMLDEIATSATYIAFVGSLDVIMSTGMMAVVKKDR